MNSIINQFRIATKLRSLFIRFAACDEDTASTHRDREHSDTGVEEDEIGLGWELDVDVQLTPQVFDLLSRLFQLIPEALEVFL